MERDIPCSHSLTLQVKRMWNVSPLPVFIAHLQNYYSSHVNRATLHLSGSENRKILPVLFKTEDLPCSSAARKVMTAEKGKQTLNVGEENECRLRNSVPTLRPLLFGLEFWCKIQIHTSRIHWVCLRFGSFAECIKGVWRIYICPWLCSEVLLCISRFF